MRLRLALIGVGLALAVASLFARRAVNVGLSVKEALYVGGSAGVARTDEPFSLSVPLPDDASTGLTGTSSMGLTGVSVGQFRVLTTHNSGRAQWVKVDGILSSLSAGTESTAPTFTSGGSGNFGGSDLATDNGATITVATGGATFTIKKANFNGFDTVVIGGTTVVSSGASDGFVILGPAAAGTFPANVTCSPDTGGVTCNVPYKSSNDAGSTCSIEENGPVRAALLCTYDFEDSGHNVYMHGTARLDFYKGKTYAKVRSILRNADDGTSSTFETAYKGHRGYELRTTLNITTTLNTYTIGDHSGGPTTGTLTGTDTASLYQAATDFMQHEDQPQPQYGTASYQITETGYAIQKNGSNVQTGTTNQVVPGWCDIANGSGVGLELGVYLMAGSYPKGCYFTAAGTVAALSILPQQASRPYYMEWPQWNEYTTAFFNFHTSNPSSLEDEFLKFQHDLIGRVTDYSYYNTAGVLPAPLVSPTVEDTYLTTVADAASPSISGGSRWATSNLTNAEDYGITNVTFALKVIKSFSWNLETDYRYDLLTNFLTRGMTGRWLYARNFYEYQAQYMLAHSDGFDWRTDVHSSINAFGYPSAVTSQNSTLGTHVTGIYSGHSWRDEEHGFWYGMTTYYALSGDEFIREAMVDQQKDWFLAPEFAVQRGGWAGSSQLDTTGVNATKVFGSSWTNALVGQIMLLDTAKLPFEVASVTDATHLVFKTSPGNLNDAGFVVFGGHSNQRSISSTLTGGIRFSEFLRGIGDADADDVLTGIQMVFDEQVKARGCMNGYPSPCITGAATVEDTASSQGVSRERGIHWGAAGVSGTYCGVAHTYRVSSIFQEALFAEAILEMATYRGTSWPDYYLATDLAYGISQWALNEGWYGGTSSHATDGFRGGMAFDIRNDCLDQLWTVDISGTTVTRGSGPEFRVGGYWTPVGYAVMYDGTGAFVCGGTPLIISTVTDVDHLTLTAPPGNATGVSCHWREENFDEAYANGAQTAWANFFTRVAVTGDLTWETKFKLAMQRSMAINGLGFRDLLGHLIARTIKTVTDTPGPVLTDVTLTGFSDNGGGSYTLQWTPVSGASYRVKWSPKVIVSLIGFNPNTNAFTGSPSTDMNWFGAENVSTAPTCSGTCSVTIATGVTSLTSPNFSVKSLAVGASSPSSTGPIRLRRP